MSNVKLYLSLLKKEDLSEVEKAFIQQHKLLHIIEESIISYSKGQSNGYELYNNIRNSMNKYL